VKLDIAAAPGAEALMNGLSVADIRARLSAAVVGRHLYLFGEVDSTNSVACRLAREGSAEGTVVLADAQTAGRGRLGQPWFSPAGVNLHASVIFRPVFPAREVARFSLIAPLALSDAIEDLGLSPAIRWPNDVLVGGKKLAGTRVECATRGEEIAHMVLGVAVDVNVQPPALQAALGPAGGHATSLRVALGREVGRNALAAAYLSRLDAWARRYAEEGPGLILAAWRARDILTGRRIEARGPRKAVEGRVLGVDASGHLLIEASSGRRHVIPGGDVRIIDRITG
jgi:BirA family transcriptional regulator, biotin operon repressor / biotin---[acetyl-CoA-carboxylase] ligase